MAVVGEVCLGDERFLIVVQPDGTRAQIPEWMALPSAASFPVHAPPRISLQGMAALRIELDAVLSLLSGTTAEPGDIDEPQQRASTSRPIHQHAGAACIGAYTPAQRRTRQPSESAALGGGSSPGGLGNQGDRP